MMSLLSSAQTLSDMHQRWDGAVEEWDVYAFGDEDLPYATIDLSGIDSQDYFMWNVILGDASGQIKRKWRDKNDFWEARIDGGLITARKKWPRDFSEWEITYDGTRYSLILDRNEASTWNLWKNRDLMFSIYTEYNNDYRDILISYENVEIEANADLQLFCLFLSTYHGLNLASGR